MGAYKRYREFGGKEQREEPRVKEFREFGTASLRGITVKTLKFQHFLSFLLLQMALLQIEDFLSILQRLNLTVVAF